MMQGSVVIVGGGVMGAATACFLARDHRVAVTVLERDPTYRRASSALSASSIRQQFSQPVNIQLSQWSVQFLRRVADELAVDGEPPAIGLVEPGYLYLATNAGVPALQRHHQTQRQHGADVALLTKFDLRQRFDWLHAGDVALASLGLSGEGWFDGPALMQAFRRKAIHCGARFVNANAVGFDVQADGSPSRRSVRSVRAADGSAWPADQVLLAAGAWVAPLAAQLRVSLPVVAKKRDVFVFDSPAALPGCPLVVDPSGLWFRPEGRGFICGAPPRDADPDEPALDGIDHAQFEEQLWPALAHRVPGFEALRLRSAWAGYYDMNTVDHNGLAGALPGWCNVFTACGFSGHGMQQAPAVGSALAAVMTGGHSDAPGLQALSPQRLLDGRTLREDNVI